MISRGTPSPTPEHLAQQASRKSAEVAIKLDKLTGEFETWKQSEKSEEARLSRVEAFCREHEAFIMASKTGSNRKETLAMELDKFRTDLLASISTQISQQNSAFMHEIQSVKIELESQKTSVAALNTALTDLRTQVQVANERDAMGSSAMMGSGRPARSPSRVTIPLQTDSLSRQVDAFGSRRSSSRSTSPRAFYSSGVAEVPQLGSLGLAPLSSPKSARMSTQASEETINYLSLGPNSPTSKGTFSGGGGGTFPSAEEDDFSLPPTDPLMDSASSARANKRLPPLPSSPSARMTSFRSSPSQAQVFDPNLSLTRSSGSGRRSPTSPSGRRTPTLLEFAEQFDQGAQEEAVRAPSLKMSSMTLADTFSSPSVRMRATSEDNSIEFANIPIPDSAADDNHSDLSHSDLPPISVVTTETNSQESPMAATDYAGNSPSGPDMEASTELELRNKIAELESHLKSTPSLSVLDKSSLKDPVEEANQVEAIKIEENIKKPKQKKKRGFFRFLFGGSKKKAAAKADASA
mmetsp:Transcript_45686/g.74511  ORF Transcript_45686/g.74511 Transcript_45686/m.74511 type:complete len:522 (+) Transcript_45686:131-1696(+)